MKEIFRAIDNAYSALDDCISKIVKSRLHKDKESEERALYKLEIETNGVLQDLSYIKRQLQKRDWIKVEDRLPEMGEEVFVTYKSSRCEDIGFRTGHRDIWGFSNTDENYFILNIGEEKVTHWMPIVPPKED